MLGMNEWHHDLIRKYNKLFGTLFADLEVYRENTSGPASLQKVPLSFAPRDKVLEFSRINYTEDSAAVATVSPRISYDLVNMQYDTSRKTNKFQPIKLTNGTTRNYVPYNLIYELYIVGKTETDCQRVVEQIIPFFDPSMTITVKPLVGETYTRDIALTLNQISKSDSYEGQAEDRRIVIWTLVFTMQAFVFGPTKAAGGIIKKVILSFNDLIDAENIDHSEFAEIYPGVTANNQPTSNTSLAIDYKTVNANANFAYITTFSPDPIE